MIKLLQHHDALLIDSVRENSYDSTLSDHASSGECFTSSQLVWDPGIISSFNMIQSMECEGVVAFLEDKQYREGRIMMSLSR